MTGVTDDFRKNERMEGRTLIIDGAEFADTREKLEADVRKVLKSAYMYAWMHGYENRRGCSFEKLHREFYNLLDRQDAITRAECERICDTCEWPSLAAQPDQEAYDRIADLQAELEEVSRAYKERGRTIAELTAERDHLQGVVMQQAESFRKLEAASAMPADCTECKHLDEMRALRRRIRKLARFAGLLD